MATIAESRLTDWRGGRKPSGSMRSERSHTARTRREQVVGFRSVKDRERSRRYSAFWMMRLTVAAPRYCTPLRSTTRSGWPSEMALAKVADSAATVEASCLPRSHTTVSRASCCVDAACPSQLWVKNEVPVGSKTLSWLCCCQWRATRVRSTATEPVDAGPTRGVVCVLSNPTSHRTRSRWLGACGDPPKWRAHRRLFCGESALERCGRCSGRLSLATPIRLSAIP